MLDAFTGDSTICARGLSKGELGSAKLMWISSSSEAGDLTSSLKSWTTHGWSLKVESDAGCMLPSDSLQNDFPAWLWLVDLTPAFVFD